MSHFSRFARFASPLTLLLLGVAAHAQTTAVPVTNGDFSSPVEPATSNNLITAWGGPTPDAYSFGVQNGANIGPRFGGAQYAYIYNGSYIQQDTGFLTTAGYTYTLTGSIGKVAGEADFASLNLFDAQGNLLATTGSQTSSDNVFTPYSTSFTALTSGNDLVIRLVKTGSSDNSTQGFFDDISLTQTAPVPEASSVVSLGLLLALGVGGAAVSARRRRANASA